MSLLNSILGSALQSALGGGQQAAGGNLVNMVLGMLQGGQGGAAGGLQSIIGQLTKAGLGQQVQSWVGTGQNMPVSADQLAQAFGPGQMQQWAQQLGLNHEQTAGGLAAALPEIINHLTPNGQVPHTNELDGLMGMLKGALGR